MNKAGGIVKTALLVRQLMLTVRFAMMSDDQVIETLKKTDYSLLAHTKLKCYSMHKQH